MVSVSSRRHRCLVAGQLHQLFDGLDSGLRPVDLDLVYVSFANNCWLLNEE